MSINTALLTLSNTLYRKIYQRKVSLITLCDLSKAFDNVSHDKFKDKCFKLNTDSFWFQSYLTKRTHAVGVESKVSSTNEISYGVPHGSVLGAILCIICANNFLQYFADGSFIPYADNTQFIHTGVFENILDLISISEKQS